MSFDDCIRTAVEAGKLGANKAAQATDYYARLKDEAIAGGMSADAADTVAAGKVLERITTLTANKRWQRINEMRKAHTLFEEFNASKTPAKSLLDLGERLNIFYDRIRGQAMTNLDRLILKYKPKFGGLVEPVDNMDNIPRAAFGDIRNEEAGQLANAIMDTFEWLRQRLNMEGANIPANKNRVLPQTHDRLKVRAVPKEEWVADHLRNSDWEIMRFQGDEIPVDKRVEVLGSMYEGIVTNGNSRLKPGQANNTPLAGRLARDRFLYYKDGDAWLEMQEKYGSGNVFQQVVGMIDSMSKDAANMELLGPNPNTMKFFVEHLADKKAAELELASPRKGKSEGKKVDEAKGTWEREYNIFNQFVINGEENVMAQTIATVRTVTLAAKLGAVFLASLGDIGITKWTRGLYGLPTTGVTRSYFSNFVRNKESAQRAINAGIVFESGLSLAHSFQRYFGPLDGPHWARKFSDVVFRSGLATLHTQTVSNAAGLELLGFFAEHAGKAFDETPFGPAMRASGITEAEWNLFRATPLHEDRGAKFLRPIDMTNAAVDEPTKRAADKFQDFMQRFIHLASPRPNLRVRAFLGEDIDANRVMGQFVRSATMLASFPATIFFNHLGKIAQMETRDKIKHGARFFAYLTAGGAFVTQAKEVAKGKDPMDMTSAQFWGKAVVNGGSLGILGDVVFNNINISNSSYNQTNALKQDWKVFQKLTFDNIIDLWNGDKVSELDVDKDAYNFVNNFTPKLWQFKLLFNRAIGDHLFEETDPAGYRKMKQNARAQEQETGQGEWWGADEEPRAPDLAGAIGQE